MLVCTKCPTDSTGSKRLDGFPLEYVIWSTVSYCFQVPTVMEEARGKGIYAVQ